MKPSPACRGGQGGGFRLSLTPTLSRKRERGKAEEWESRGTPLLAQRHALHVEEHLRRIELVALHLLAHAADLQDRVEEDPRRIVEDQLLRLVVKRDALGMVALALRLAEEIVDLGVLVARRVGDGNPRRAVELVEEVVRIAVV